MPSSSWPATAHGMRTAWVLMVMPRSRSMSMRSRYCARISRSSTTPVSCSMRSASVDLPWSMCAMMQKLRISSAGVAAGWMRLPRSALGIGDNAGAPVIGRWRRACDVSTTIGKATIDAATGWRTQVGQERSLSHVPRGSWGAVGTWSLVVGAGAGQGSCAQAGLGCAGRARVRSSGGSVPDVGPAGSRDASGCRLSGDQGATSRISRRPPPRSARPNRQERVPWPGACRIITAPLASTPRAVASTGRLRPWR